jgi:hypothetical protein
MFVVLGRLEVVTVRLERSSFLVCIQDVFSVKKKQVIRKLTILGIYKDIAPRHAGSEAGQLIYIHLDLLIGLLAR